jgi:hypothetical protein
MAMVSRLLEILRLIFFRHRCPNGVADCSSANLCAECYDDRQW